ncbi:MULTISPECIES: sporulation integral membrane protein YtvI [Aneurinibacillus]|uniref:Sporulation integral membrane protein YtvI n=1 Tax=Aneurinibacillus thermoaerophilus TaxID=143495 RepID=A0A1G8CEY5_ANETH|nr:MULTISPECIES: sporulation integral membrane protein YtvI [Aneurinibacillus]AMA71883.1 sporulation protein [Aneurinibacillus sp. XH2]MED0674161.1 sporulation integral membrane protein YtvI [Aneurinibacillus thermoaerophilus]MED0680441.1 sporulation integral membrane protein YtvI [Aneurinibacillus thermoaerophilus]MED0737302.1 sporulation integral membrane protein YtvI [Aneurinibacillus thermoaerophilus]MED0758631.1 sporulation integral membrane protein YtvI [Aneurinibacillus thermoaerophilus
MATIRKTFFWILILAIAVFLIPYALPFILALFTAIFLEPIVKFFMRSLNANRLIAVTLTFLLFFAIFGLGGYRLGSILVVQTVELAGKLPELSSKVMEFLEHYMWKWEAYAISLPFDTTNTIQDVIQALKTSATNAATAITKVVLSGVAAIPGFFIVAIIYLVALFLISLDLPRLHRNFLNLFTDSAREKVELVMNQLFRATVGFLRAQVILSLLTYILALIGLMILGVKYALLLSLIIVIVDLLPILGTGSFLVPWAIYSFAVGNSRLAIGLVILFVAITIIRRIIEPKVLGSSLGISALAALISLYVGFQLLGFIGLILGPALIIVFESLRKAGFLKFKIDF